MNTETATTATPAHRERVSVVRCVAAESEDAAVMARTAEAIEPHRDALRERLRGARTVAVKINAGVDRAHVLTDGRQTELTDPAVIEASLRALRSVTDAELIVGDAATEGDTKPLYDKLGLPARLADIPNTRLVDFNDEPNVVVGMPHATAGLAMFRRYAVPRAVAEADAVVSLAKMKAHMSVGCTLSIKNLFGWMPTAVYGAPRHYLHDHLVRLPRVLADLALWTRPCLCIVDATVAASKSEWGGEALRPGLILAGTNAVAVDSVGARAMGFDPDGDYPDPPFFYRRNPIRIASRAGLGSNRAEDVEVLGPQPEEVLTRFEVHGYGKESMRRRVARRNEEFRAGARCVAAYNERRAEYLERYGAGRLLALRDGGVLWDGPDARTVQRLARESGRDWKSGAQVTLRCVPEAEEDENLDWYERDASDLPDPDHYADVAEG